MDRESRAQWKKGERQQAKTHMRICLVSILLVLLLPRHAVSQDLRLLGGDLTSDAPLQTVLELPAPNIASSERINLHLSSHEDFHSSFEHVKSGRRRVLGPFFNHNSCAGCHVKNGRGEIGFPRKSKGSSMIIKVSLKGSRPGGTPLDVPGIGEQLQDRTVSGKTRFGIKLRWKLTRGRYPDGTIYQLRTPALSFSVPNVRKKRIVSSLRMTPPITGMGLLEAVPAETLLSLADPDDLNGDGISGRISYVPDRETGKISIGRFGFRATHPTVKQQSAAAFFHDMGITGPLFPGKKGEQEISAEQLSRVTFYQQLAAIPPARNQDDPSVIAGKAIFQQIRCNDCHVMTLRTGDSPIPELRNQEFHPFTDLLLHDMGPELADDRPEFSASGREWRTTPLWGLGLHEFISGNDPGFLHDGRARTIEEAIIWHGGEAAPHRNRFMNLSAFERFQLIKFLQSL